MHGKTGKGTSSLVPQSTATRAASAAEVCRSSAVKMLEDEMTSLPKTRRALPISLASLVVAIALLSPLHAQQISLQTLVNPSTTIIKDGHPLTFALHGFIEFNSLSELFPYIESQTQRWKDASRFDDAARRELARDLLRRGIESRVKSLASDKTGKSEM